MSDPRLTEERLRSHLDSNQAARERMCLALLPLLGPYTQEAPRRPKGGPDGGRDIEAIFQGSKVAWGGVGFRSGGGNDSEARKEAENKFRRDLDSTLSENPTLQVFFFFTNVDLTPGLVQSLKTEAQQRGMINVDIFDMERLRHVLDSPEGLLARLQYLDIPMSNTDQAALIDKYGARLHSAIVSRFDRMEETLQKMERFLDLQRPIHRLDLFVKLRTATNSVALGRMQILVRLHGIVPESAVSVLCTIDTEHRAASHLLATISNCWVGSDLTKSISGKSLSLDNNVIASWNEVVLTRGLAHRISPSELSLVRFEAACTESLRPLVTGLAFDINGYEVFDRSPEPTPVAAELPAELVQLQNGPSPWATLMIPRNRDLAFSPLARSSRWKPLLFGS